MKLVFPLRMCSAVNSKISIIFPQQNTETLGNKRRFQN